MRTSNDLASLVDVALAQGAKGAEVVARRSQGWKLRLAGKGTPTSEETADEELVVRVWVEAGRTGIQRGRLDQGEELVGQALASTFESPEDSYAGPVEKLGTLPSGLSILDRRHPNLELNDRVDALQDVVHQASADRRFQPGVFEYEDSLMWRAVANSRGVEFEEQSSRFHIGGTLTGGGLTIHDFVTSRAFSSVASLPLGTRMIQRADALLADGRGLPKGPVRVVLPPLPVARILMAIGDQFLPDVLASGSFMFRDLGDSRSISPQIHVVDDGQLPGGLRSRGFDDRGSFPMPLLLLREGVVAGRFLTPERARRLKTRPTGHVWGDEVHSNNLIMRGGTRSINALLTELGGPSLMIDDLPDLSGLDLKTGDFEVTVNGVVMEANHPVGAMRGVVLRGNLVTLLSNVVEICNNTDRIAHIDAASMIADGLELT